MKRFIEKEKRDATERVGFYVALTICIIAVGLAIWSAYSTFGKNAGSDSNHYFASLRSSATQAVAQDMTGVTEGATEPSSVPTQAPTSAPTARTKGFTIYDTETMPTADETETEENGGEELSAMQAVLKVTDSLVYPVKSRSVLKQYSESAVFNQTMKDYRAHTGCDFVAEEGENVYAMCDGTVMNISVSELYGVITEIRSQGFSVYYCGLGNELSVKKGDVVTTGDTIGTVGQIPCENADDSHVHIEIRVGNKLIDPLSVINKDE